MVRGDLLHRSGNKWEILHKQTSMFRQFKYVKYQLYDP